MQYNKAWRYKEVFCILRVNSIFPKARNPVKTNSDLYNTDRLCQAGGACVRVSNMSETACEGGGREILILYGLEIWQRCRQRSCCGVAGHERECLHVLAFSVHLLCLRYA